MSKTYFRYDASPLTLYECEYEMDRYMRDFATSNMHLGIWTALANLSMNPAALSSTYLIN